MIYFYMVRCSDNSLYCGVTRDLNNRIQQHNSRTTKAAKYTRSRQPVVLVYVEEYAALQPALKREYEVKQWPKARKESLVKTLTPSVLRVSEHQKTV